MFSFSFSFIAGKGSNDGALLWLVWSKQLRRAYFIGGVSWVVPVVIITFYEVMITAIAWLLYIYAWMILCNYML
jgi:hypothetical protein